MKKQSLGILLSLMGAACLYTGCNNDVTPGQEGAECSPACGEMQECVNGECKDLETPPLPPSCDPACGENQECVDGECKDKQTGPETNTCANANETNCDGGCFDLTSDKDNCGECGKICPSGEICENSQCKAEEVEAECQDTDAPTCEGNAVKKCENGHFVTTDCEALTCENGECKTLAECSDDMEPFCDGNAVKSCKSGHYDLLDCQNKACVAGACSDETFEKECDNDGVSVCDNNQVKTCKAGKFEYQNCTAAGLTCETTDDGVQCVAVEKPECTESDAPTCEGNSLKSCVDGKFAFEACPGICENGACKAVAIEDLCPDDASKTAPGVCGCGIPDIDSDNNGTMDCQELDSNGNPLDLCPDDPNKLLPGICGCGIPDDINENSGNPYCLEFGDLCPEDAGKTMPGVCGCGYSDKINEFTNIPHCIGVDIVGNNIDLCDNDSNKLLAGTCGCGISDELDAEKHIPKCVLSEDDLCVNDAEKTKPGICGCGVVDDETDSDSDGVPDCIDQCPDNPVKYIDDDCGCNEIKVSLDGSDFCAIPINTAAEFNDLKTGTLLPNKNYAIMDDINLYGYFGTTSINDWVGIKNFSGKLVSNGKTISFKKDSSLGTLKCSASPCGLFNNLSGARINNVNFELNIETTKGNAGILAGTSANSVLTNIAVNGNIKSAGQNVGGLIGSATATTIKGIKRDGNVLNNANNTGGVVGSGDGIITNIESKGTIEGSINCGGVAGSFNGTASDLLAEGSVKGLRVLGGIIGNMSGNTISNAKSNVSLLDDGQNTAWEGYVGGIVGNLSTSNKVHFNLINHGEIKFYSKSYCSVGVAGVIGNVSGGGNTFKDTHNYGNVNADSCHSSGGVIGLSSGVNLENVSNNGTVLIDGNKSYNAPVYVGGIIGSWRSGGTYKLKNVKNTGNVSGGQVVGGIIGYLSQEASTATLEMSNIVNTGAIKSLKTNGYGWCNSIRSTGGLFGSYYCSNGCSLTDAYSTGDVSSDMENVGGIIGYMHKYDNDWNGSPLVLSTNSKNIYYKFDRLYSEGTISGKTNVGGLIGNLELDFNNRSRSQAQTTIVCADDPSKTQTQPAQWTWYAGTKFVNISNAYATGKIISQGANVGGLFGSVSGNSRNATQSNRTYTFTKVSDADPCHLNTIDTPVSVRQNNRLVVANAFSAAQIEGGSALGGLVGNYNYANSLESTFIHLFNNVYSTGTVPAKGGALFGTVPSNVTFKNLYYWPKSGPDNVTPSGTVTGAVSFDYVAGVPHIAQDDVDLLNQLNGNVKSSSSDELNTKVSATWAAKEHVITGKVKANIPFLEIAPEEMPWEVEQQQEESGRD